MINIDSLTIKALIAEIAQVFTSGRVQKVQQPNRDDLLLFLRSGGKSYKFFISINPKYPHAAFIGENGEKCRNIEIPKIPPMFCMLLRKHLEGAKIRSVHQPDYERIIEIGFESYNELGARVPLLLAIELMGKHSNIVLYNADTNMILGSAHGIGSEKSREREIAGGLPYVYPPKQKKFDILKLSEHEFYNLAKILSDPLDIWLNKSFHHISLALATELCETVGISTDKNTVSTSSVEKLNELYKLIVKTLRLENLNPSVSKDKRLFSLTGLSPDVQWDEVESVNSMIDNYFAHHVYKDKFSKLKSQLTSAVNRELKKGNSSYFKHSLSIESGDKASKYKLFADLLMANLNNIKSNSESAIVNNYLDENKEIIIPLDSSKTALNNAQHYYKLYNKAKNAAKKAEELLNNIKKDLDYFESILVSIDMAENLSDLTQIQKELLSQEILKTERSKTKIKEDKEALNPLKYDLQNGYSIYIGRNNRQNDYIVSQIASPDDIWLHTQNIQGSHVLIKVTGEEVPDEVLLEAANLAACFSKAGGSSNVPVIYTKRRFLKKPPGAKPGYVTYSGEKTIIVTPDRNLIKKLT